MIWLRSIAAPDSNPEVSLSPQFLQYIMRGGLDKSGGAEEMAAL